MIAKTSYIQIYAYTQDGEDYLQVNTFLPDNTLLMQTYLKGEDLSPEKGVLLFELDYPVQEEKYASLRRSLEKHFEALPHQEGEGPILQIKRDNQLLAKSYSVGKDLLFDRLYDKFTRIVTYSSIPSG